MSSGVTSLLTFWNDALGVLLYSASTLAVILNNFSKLEYLLISIRSASVFSLARFVTLISVRTFNVSGSWRCVVVSFDIGHSLSGSLRKLGPFCQLLLRLCQLVFYHALCNQQCCASLRSSTRILIGENEK